MASCSSSPSERGEANTLTLKSNDGVEFVIDHAVASLSVTIRNMIEDDCVLDVIPLVNVDGKTLAKVIEYCKKHKSNGPLDELLNFQVDEEVKSWDTEFINVDTNTVFDLILAANYLNIKGLLDLGCETIAGTMSGKSVEEIRKIFHIKNDYTMEEENEVRREIAWVYEE